jgi:hypothetical protein
MSGGSGMEQLVPMMMMQQASRIDPLYYGQGAVDDINQTVMDMMMDSMSAGQRQDPANAAVPQTEEERAIIASKQATMPSKDKYNQTVYDAMNYINTIAANTESQNYDYGLDSTGKKTRVKKTDATVENEAFYTDHEKNAAAYEQLKDWNKKRKSTSTSSSTSGGSLLSGGTDLEALFAGLLGGGK